MHSNQDIHDALVNLVKKYAKDACQCDLMYGIHCSIHSQLSDDLECIAKMRQNRKEELTAVFQRLAEEWKIKTGGQSSPSRVSMDDAYQRIIALGPEVVPIILDELETHGGHWFPALRALTGEQPVLEEHAGRVQLMKEDWRKWREENKERYG